MQVVPSGKGLGARIEGLDLSRPLDERQVEEIIQIIGRYGVLCFPRQRLTATQHRDFAARFGELDPPVSEETAFWALRDCHLMRNRFTLADLLFFIGWWDDGFVERLFDRARSVGGGL